MRTVLAIAAAALAVLSCGGGSSTTDGGGADAGPPDLGMDCTDDGTPLGACRAYKCALAAESLTACGAANRVTFDCTAFATLPADYLTRMQCYWHDCGAALSMLADADVPVGMGMTAHVTACQQLGFAVKPESLRHPMCDPMTIYAEVAPLPVACAYPDPPVAFPGMCMATFPDMYASMCH